MLSRRLLPGFCLSLAFTVPTTRHGQACAVATTIRVENRSTLPVRSLHVSKPFAGTNQLAAAGLPPGEAATITLPSCMGVYEVSATFVDGRVVAHPDLNAASIRQLVLR